VQKWELNKKHPAPKAAVSFFLSIENSKIIYKTNLEQRAKTRWGEQSMYLRITANYT